MRNCAHLRRRVVWTEFNNYGDRYQSPQLRYFCDDCGWLVGSALKHSTADSDTPTLGYEQVTQVKREQDAYFQRQADERTAREAERRAEYNAYLQSPEWAQRRELVLTRSNGYCEGCGTALAVQVHHLTYQHCGNEFLWELVAVCRACHERAHGII